MVKGILNILRWDFVFRMTRFWAVSVVYFLMLFDSTALFLQSPIGAVLVVYAHHKLIHSIPKTSSFLFHVVSWACILTCLAIPLIDHRFVFIPLKMFGLSFHLIYSMGMLAMIYLDRELLQSWTFTQALYYLQSGIQPPQHVVKVELEEPEEQSMKNTEPSPSLRKRTTSKSKESKPIKSTVLETHAKPKPKIHADPIPYKNITTRFLVSELTRLAIPWTLLVTALRNFPYKIETTRSFVDFSQPAHILNTILHGLNVCFMIQVSAVIVYMTTAPFLHHPYTQTMSRPWEATSIRDLWGRWNFPMQARFKDTAFLPFMNLLGHDLGKKDRRVPALHIALGAMITFIWSGCYHEYTLLAMDNSTLKLEQLAFFTVHGVISVLEGVAARMARRFGVGDVPVFVKRAYVMVVFVWTGPMFANSFIEGDLYSKVATAIPHFF